MDKTKFKIELESYIITNRVREVIQQELKLARGRCSTNNSFDYPYAEGLQKALDLIKEVGDDVATKKIMEPPPPPLPPKARTLADKITPPMETTPVFCQCGVKVKVECPTCMENRIRYNLES